VNVALFSFPALLLGIVYTTAVWSADSSDKAAAHSFTVESARIEQILATEDEGYRSVVYVVSWRGRLVGVTDPLSDSHHQVGDQIKMLVMRWQAPDNSQLKVLGFTLNEPPK
jgi:hypothetical protein